MFRRRILPALVVLALTGVVFVVFFGLRVVFYGGMFPHLRFLKSKTAQAEEISRNRQSQPMAIAKAPTAAADAYWTDFRGPLRDGHYLETPILTSWPDKGLAPIWKQPIGGGYASFVVARGRAFTIEQRGHDEVVVAYDPKTGRELWKTGWPGEFHEFMGGDGPRATPTWSDGFVYALGALGEFRCLDEETGRVIWRTNILSDNSADNLQWGMAAAPLVVDDAVIVLPGGRNGHSVAAYNRRTGARLWTALSDKQAYTSPM